MPRNFLGVACCIAGVLIACLAVWVQRTALHTTPPVINAPVRAERYLPDTPANRALRQAIAIGDVEKVRAALDAGGAPEAVYSPGGKVGDFHLVFMASYKPSDKSPNYFPIFRLLMNRVRDVNLREPFNQETLLMAAADMGDLVSIRSLVKRGAAINAVSAVNARGSGFGPTGGEDALYKSVSRVGIKGLDPDPIVAYLLANGADARHVCADGSTALMRAAQFGKIATVRLLLQKNADTNQRDAMDFTALRWAMMRGNDATAAVLRPLTQMNLWEAAENGNAARVKELLATGADSNALRTGRRFDQTTGKPSMGSYGETPLMAAVRSNDPATVKALLDAGANVRFADSRSGETALSIAATYGSAAVIPLLLHAGADINAAAIPQDDNGKPLPNAVELAQTPLLCAVTAAQADTVALLLRSGVKMAANDQGGRSLEDIIGRAGRDPDRPIGLPTYRAIRGNATLAAQTRIVDLLLKAGANANVAELVVIAAQSDQPDILELLLEHGASPNTHWKNYTVDQTPLLAVIQQIGNERLRRKYLPNGTESQTSAQQAHDRVMAYQKCVADLLKHGANVNEATDKGESPFMAAVDAGDYTLAGDLLQRGAKREFVDADGRTALLRAAAANDLAAVSWLLQIGADSHARDRNGYTALMLAIDSGDNDRWAQEKASGRTTSDRPNPDGHPALAKYLLAHGADRTAVANDHQTTALTLAQKNGFPEVQALL